MKKRFWILLGISAVIMIGLPPITPWLLQDSGGFGTILILFYMIDPIWSGVLGAFSKKFFLLPLINSLLYVLGAWCFFDFGNTDFLLFGAVYLGIGWVVQLIALLLQKLVSKKKKETA